MQAARELAWTEHIKIETILNDIPDLGEAQFFASGRVVSSGAPQTGFSFSVLHTRSRKTIIEVEVTIRDSVNGKTISALGRGSAERSSTSAVFDLRGKEVALDQSTIGVATQKAIAMAIETLERQIVVENPQ